MDKAKLPDFDEMFELVEMIKALSTKRAKLKSEIEATEAKTVRIVSNDPKYYMGGKPPSITYINVTWKYTGLNDELVDKRRELAEVEAALDGCKLLLDYDKAMIEVWRTISANERMAIA